MQGLSNEMMRHMAPSIFAIQPYHEVSNHYRFVPTIEGVNALRKGGWYPAKVQESRTRLEDKRGFKKHLVRSFGPRY